MPGGRPSKLTPQRAALIQEHVSRGMGRNKAARFAGIDPATFHRWMAKGQRSKTGPYRHFRDGLLWAEASLQERATRVIGDLLDHNHAGVRLGAAKFVLERKFPEDWGSRQRIETTGADGAAVKVEAKFHQPLFTNEQLGRDS